MDQFIEKIKKKENLSFNESKAAFELLMEGKASDYQIFPVHLLYRPLITQKLPCFLQKLDLFYF